MLKRELEALLSAQKQNNPLADLKFLRPVQVPKVYPISRARLYQLLADGSIKSILLRQKHAIRGSRLISVASIEAYFAWLAREQKDEKLMPVIARGDTEKTSRTDKVADAPRRADTKKAAGKTQEVPQRRGRGRPRKVRQKKAGKASGIFA